MNRSRARRITRIVWPFIAAAGLAASCRLSDADRLPAPGLAEGPPSIPAELLDRPLYTFTEDELDLYLRGSRCLEPELRRRVVALGRKNIGQPYEIYLLGEFPFESHDADPIYCLARSDCLTFAEHTYAMALASDWPSYLRTLQRLRYRDGIIGMVTRNHYTLADWNPNNGLLFEDLTDQLGGGEMSAPLRQVCRRARFFAKFGVGQDIPDEPIEDVYIPKGNIPLILNELRDADFVNIIRGNADSQWAGHTGLIALDDNGTVNFLHSARPKVREEPLLGYVRNDKRCLGIKVLRLRSGAEAVMRQVLASSPQATEVSGASLSAALARRCNSAPLTARPPKLGWRQAMRLQSCRLGDETPVDPGLQAALERIDHRLGEQLGIPESERALGVLDLAGLRLAMVRPDRMFYAASVPKICILLAYMETHPGVVGGMPENVRHELSRMTKVSDNELAAKYGEMIGIDRIQEVLQSGRYRLYDQEHGGGFWYGKHYRRGLPRTGDPVHDYSHGATIRQCLRFYLMMEQGRLVSPAACALMRQIFAAPELELGDTKFVAGLQGRDLTLIRKSGTWKDWHLDTARIEHGDRVYFLAGMVHHPAGADYLAQAAAAVDEHLCGTPTGKPFSHRLIVHDTAEDFAEGRFIGGKRSHAPAGVILTCPPQSDSPATGEAAVYESPVITSEMLFNEVVLSWNVDAPPHVGFCVDARVGRRRDNTWSPYLHFAGWGPELPRGERTTECDQGRIDIDYFRSDKRFDCVQYRMRAVSTESLGGAMGDAKLRIGRMTICLSDTTGRVTSVPRPEPSPFPDARLWQRRLPVPFRSQRTDRPELSGRICSPTSVSMVMEYRGTVRPTEEVAGRIYDATHDIYGNWPRAVQAAHSYGVPGHLARFSDWAHVARCIANDQPLVISISVNEGELSDAPYASTEGHLLVLAGFDADGNVMVNDPASPTPAGGKLTYKRHELETVWMKAKGGLAYVLLAPRVPEPASVPPNLGDEPLVDVSDVDPRIVLDLRYATANNFIGRPLYPTARCLLRKSVARRLRRVQDRLVRLGLGLKVYDGYRPLSVQRKMWRVLPDPAYVANPAKGSRHNRGAAVDVTLVDTEGRELEMPTEFDDFTPAAHRSCAGGTVAARRNRDLLTRAMEAEGFQGLETEWWHFDAPGWEQYGVLDVPLTDAR